MSTADDTSGSQPMSHREILVVLAGLLTGMFLVALSQTSITTALPTIAGELGGVDLVAWIVTAYLLAATAATPLFGRISDVYGRDRIFKLALLIFLAGSVLAALAPTMVWLIAARAVQGVGGGGAMVLTMTIIGDILSPRERGRYQGYLGAVFGVAAVSGPLVGGVLVDQLDWRWVFWMNVPLGAAALVVTSKVLHLPSRRVQQRIDYLGALLLVVGVSALLLGAAWGGNQYAWGSPVIITLGVTGVVLSALFVLRQRTTEHPIIPLRLFTSRTFSLAASGAFVVGALMFTAMVFLPVFLQLVTGATATEAGLLMGPLMAGLILASVVSGRLITRTGRYKRYPIAGTALSGLAFALLATMDVDTTRLQAGVFMALLGIGLGMVMQNLILVAQNDAPAADLGIVTATVNFTRTLGGSIGTAVFGAVMAAGLTARLRRTLPEGTDVDPAAVQGTPQAILSMETEVRDAVVEAFSGSVSTVFVASVPLAVIAFVLMWLIPEHPLRETAHIGSARTDLPGSGVAGAAVPPETRRSSWRRPRLPRNASDRRNRR